VTYPYRFFVVRYAFNDALVAMLLVYALLAIASPTRRGLLLGLATAAKFFPAALFPVFLTAGRQPFGRSRLAFVASFALATFVMFLPFLLIDGVSTVYHRTVGYQASREPLSTLWGR
jgi:uncharacterized membrane protein